jgi:NADPH:quinone reductase-like Zn-dependent oxidoreductase
MSLLVVSIVAILALFITILSSVIIYFSLVRVTKKIEVLKIQLNSNSMLVNELINTNHLLQQELHSSEQEGKQLAIENSQVLKQLELRIKYLHEDNVKKQKIFLQWQENQSQDKFYNRAFKLVEKGASLEEIMSECELPRAEVEMLMSVHKQRW